MSRATTAFTTGDKPTTRAYKTGFVHANGGWRRGIHLRGRQNQATPHATVDEAHAWVATCAGSSGGSSWDSFDAALARLPLPAYITLLYLYTVVDRLRLVVVFLGWLPCHWRGTESLAELAGQL